MATRMVKVEETGNENEKPVGPRVLVSEIVMIDLPEGTSLSFIIIANICRTEERPTKEDANSGSNLFVSGIAPRMSEDELEEVFTKYGRVEKVQIMVDPHSRESRGFGFVQMSTPEEADAAKEALTGEERYGRVLTIEKARRNRASMSLFIVLEANW